MPVFDSDFRDVTIKKAAWFLIFFFPVSVLFINQSFTPFMLLMAVYGIVLIFKTANSGVTSGFKPELFFLKTGLAGIVFSLLSLFLSNDPFGISSSELEYFDKQFRFLFFAVFIIMLKKTGVHERLVWWGAVLAASCSGIYAVFYKLVNPEIMRVAGGGNPINYGCFSVISAFIALNGLLFFRKYGKMYVLIPGIAFFSGMTGAVFSGSRGAWLAVPLLAVITMINFRKYFRPLYCIAVIVSFLVCLFAVARTADNSVFYSRISEAGAAVQKYFHGGDGDALDTSTDNAYISIGGRLEMYRVAVNIIKNNPLLGAGPGRYQKTVKEYIDSGKADRGIEIYQYPHNDYLTAAACGGIFGLVFFVLTVYLLPFYLLYESSGKSAEKSLFWAGLVIIAGFMVFSLSNSALFKNIRLHYYFLMLAAICASLYHQQKNSPEGEN